MHTDSLWRNLGLVMYVGAAIRSATPEQGAALRKVLQPLLERHKTEDQAVQIVEAVRRTMQPGWKPAPQWRGFWAVGEEW